MSPEFSSRMLTTARTVRFFLLVIVALAAAAGLTVPSAQAQGVATFQVTASGGCRGCSTPGSVVSLSGRFVVDLTTGTVLGGTMSVFDSLDLISSPVTAAFNFEQQLPPNLDLFFGQPSVGGQHTGITLYFPFTSFPGNYSGGPICGGAPPPPPGCVSRSGGFIAPNDMKNQSIGGMTITIDSGTVSPFTGQPTPLLNSLSPTAAAPGGAAFTLTVLGGGFQPNAVVNWNGSPRATSFVDFNKLTATITAADIANAGTAKITVTNPAPGGGTSNAEPFQVTNALTATNFTVFSNNEIDGYRSGRSTTLAGDFNGDGKLDLVAYANGFIYFLPGNGDGTFGSWVASVGPPASSSSTSPNTSLATADLNGDGVPDLVLMNANGTFIALGNGNGTFRLLSTSLSDVISSGTIMIADFNGDGFVDLAYTTTPFTVPAVPTAIQVQLGNGDGTFRTGPATVFPLANPNGPTQFLIGTLGVGDVNGDSVLDLLVAADNPSGCQGGSWEVLFYPGNGDGSFGTPSVMPGTPQCGGSFPSLAVGDFNGDGTLDVAYLMQVGTFGSIGILMIDLGNGDGTFRVPYQYSSSPTLNQPTGPLQTGDFNGDGKLDLVAGSQLFYGNGDGSLTPYGPAVAGLQVVQVGDFNGDGKVDLLALGTNPTNSSQFDLRLLTQVPAPPDFGGGLTPTTQTIVPGGSGSYAGQVTALNGFTGNVALSASGTPTGVTVSFNPSTVTGGTGSYTMMVSVASSVPLGTYGITVTGTSGTLVHSTTVTLIVNSSPGDFSGAVAASSDAYQNIFAGQNATYVFQITPSGGFSGDVTLNVSGLPSGTTASFNPGTIHGGSGSSTLTVFTTSATPLNCNPFTPTLGSCALVISATSGPLTHSGDVFLGIRTSPGDFTGTLTPSSQTISVGQTATYSANISYSNGFSPSGGICLYLSVAGLPPGAQVGRISQMGCSTGESDTIPIFAPPGTTPGTYTLVFTGFGGGRVRAGTATLTIQ